MIKLHRIYIKKKDIMVLEGVEEKTAARRIKKIQQMYNCIKPTIADYAKFNGNSEEYIIKNMCEMKLI